MNWYAHNSQMDNIYLKPKFFIFNTRRGKGQRNDHENESEDAWRLDRVSSMRSQSIISHYWQLNRRSRWTKWGFTVEIPAKNLKRQNPPPFFSSFGFFIFSFLFFFLFFFYFYIYHVPRLTCCARIYLLF